MIKKSPKLRKSKHSLAKKGFVSVKKFPLRITRARIGQLIKGYTNSRGIKIKKQWKKKDFYYDEYGLHISPALYEIYKKLNNGNKTA